MIIMKNLSIVTMKHPQRHKDCLNGFNNELKQIQTKVQFIKAQS